MIESRGLTAVALLMVLGAAQTAHAADDTIECADDEKVAHHAEWRGQLLRDVDIAATPGRFLVSWRGADWTSATIEGDAVRAGVAQPISPTTTVVAVGPDVSLRLNVVSDRIVGQRLTRDGAPLGEPVELGTGGAYENLTAVFDGARFVVAWSGSSASTKRYGIHAAGLEVNGDLRPAVYLGESEGPRSVYSARAGDVTWVLWNDDSSSADRRGIRGVRLDAAGTSLDAAPVLLSKGNRWIVAAASAGDVALAAVRGAYDHREVVPLDAGGARPPVALTTLPFVGVVSLTGAPGGDGFLLWTTPDGSSPQPQAVDTVVTAYALGRDGVPRGSAPFTTLRGSTTVVAFDGDQLRYAVIEEVRNLQVSHEGYSRIRTGRITAQGRVEGDTVLASEAHHFDTSSYCVTPYYGDSCSASALAPGATSAGLVLVGALLMVLPRRRRR